MQTNMSPSGSLLLASLERRLPKQTFDTWFRPLTVNASLPDCVFKFSAPNAIVKDWVVAHYAELIKESLRELSLEHYKIEWSANRAAEGVPGHPGSAAIIGSDDNVRIRDTAGPETDQIPAFIETIPASLNEKYTFSNFVVA